MKPRRPHCLLVVATLVIALGTSAAATDISLNPKATYLHVCSDAALNAPALVLADLAIVPGEVLLLEILGDWDNGPGGDTFISTCAVFSASDVLLDGSQLHRVPDAIAAGDPVTTSNTYYCNEPTDIPEDFRVASSAPNTSVVVQVPPDATHLFVSACDQLFQDNSDPDGDYMIRITKLALPVERVTWGGVKAIYRE